MNFKSLESKSKLQILNSWRHSIGVYPFYLAQKAQEVGYHPVIILAGCRLNDSMGIYVATETIKHMMRKVIKVIDAKVKR